MCVGTCVRVCVCVHVCVCVCVRVGGWVGGYMCVFEWVGGYMCVCVATDAVLRLSVCLQVYCAQTRVAATTVGKGGGTSISEVYNQRNT